MYLQLPADFVTAKLCPETYPQKWKRLAFRGALYICKIHTNRLKRRHMHKDYMLPDVGLYI